MIFNFDITLKSSFLKHLDPCGAKTKVRYNNFEDEVCSKYCIVDWLKNAKNCFITIIMRNGLKVKWTTLGDWEWPTFQWHPWRLQMIKLRTIFFLQILNFEKYFTKLASRASRDWAKMQNWRKLFLHRRILSSFQLEIKLSIWAATKKWILFWKEKKKKTKYL